jgi:CheY-like chemotaxis protein
MSGVDPVEIEKENAPGKARCEGMNSPDGTFPKSSEAARSGSDALAHPDRIDKVDFSRLSVLLVDDNKFVRRLVAEILRSFGVRKILEAGSAASAISKMSIGTHFDLIICEWSMQPKDGLFVLRSVRSGKTGIRQSTPFAILSGDSRQNKVIEALAEGANSYIVKPISARLLMSHLVKLMADEKGKYELD